MRLTAMDITNKEFKKVLRGYDSDEVEDFLEEVAKDFEVLFKENSSYKERVDMLEEKLEHYTKMENTIQNTLLLAQNTAEQSKVTAQKEADLIVKNANDASQKILDKAHNDVVKVNDDYEKVKQEYIMFRAKFRNFINTQIETFESLDKEFIKNYKMGDTSPEDVKEKDTESEEEFKVKDIKMEGISDNTLNDIKSFFAKDE